MEFAEYVRFAAALIFVLGLIGVVALLAKRFGIQGPGAVTHPHAAKRLHIIEKTHLDAKRVLILVRRDDVEHLLLLGATSETVVESGIETPARTAQDTKRTSHEIQNLNNQGRKAPLRDAAQKVVNMFSRETSA